MTFLTIELPKLVPVSVNQMWVKMGTKSPEAESYMKAVAILTKMQVKGKRLPQGELTVEIVFGAPQTHWYTKAGHIRIRDLDNLAKLTLDGIFSVLDVDDSHVWDLRLRKVNWVGFHTTVKIGSYTGLCANCPQNTPKNSWGRQGKNEKN